MTDVVEDRSPFSSDTLQKNLCHLNLLSGLR